MMEEQIDQLIKQAIAEDIGDGDHSSLACIPDDAKGEVQLLVKEAGVLAGTEIARKVIAEIDPELKMKVYIADGSRIKKGDIALTISGRVLSILQAERLILNFMQRMSGIATQTAVYADKVSDLKAKVLDTRKTTPGLRAIEKMAVALGGGENHRMGLYDMIMLKDNHIDFAGGIKPAIEQTQAYLKKVGKPLRIEVEVRNFDELNEVLSIGGIHRIMLDNFSTEDTLRAVEMINGRYEIESSGGITLKTLRAYAECGVDFISVGALTHHIKSLDLSLKAV
jgi:nicotinate-nucleotide pyrophosphorylase (carboxylating)